MLLDKEAEPCQQLAVLEGRAALLFGPHESMASLVAVLPLICLVCELVSFINSTGRSSREKESNFLKQGVMAEK